MVIFIYLKCSLSCLVSRAGHWFSYTSFNVRCLCPPGKAQLQPSKQKAPGDFSPRPTFALFFSPIFHLESTAKLFVGHSGSLPNRQLFYLSWFSSPTEKPSQCDTEENYWTSSVIRGNQVIPEAFRFLLRNHRCYYCCCSHRKTISHFVFSVRQKVYSTSSQSKPADPDEQRES